MPSTEILDLRNCQGRTGIGGAMDRGMSETGNLATLERLASVTPLRRCHVRHMRGRELVGHEGAVVAFVVDSQEIPIRRYSRGPAVMVDEDGGSVWAVEADGSTDALVIGPTDMVEVVMDLAEAGFGVVGLRSAA